MVSRQKASGGTQREGQQHQRGGDTAVMLPEHPRLWTHKLVSVDTRRRVSLQLLKLKCFLVLLIQFRKHLLRLYHRPGSLLGGEGQNKAAEVECKVDCLVNFCKQKYNKKFYI